VINLKDILFYIRLNADIYNINKYDNIANKRENNHTGMIDVLLLPKPKFLIEPSDLKRKPGFNCIVITNIMRNNIIEEATLFFFINFIYIL
jgi:hypothetical protein